MTVSNTPAVQVSDIPMSVITAHEPVVGNAWISERWRVVGVVPDPVPQAHPLARRLLRAGPDGEQYLWSGLVLRLHPSEADSYYYNIVGHNPSVYIFCEADDSGEPRPRFVTLDYIDALSHAECGNSTFSVPMPPEIYRRVEQFVLDHYTPEEGKMKRKHERDANAGGIREDD